MHEKLAPSPETRRFGLALVVLSLAAIAWLTLRPAHAGSSLESHLCLVCGPEAGVDILLNTLLFIPLGAGLRLSGLSLWKALFLCFLLSLSIETAQALVVRGRASTLSDLLTNTLGGAIGACSAHTARAWLAPSRRAAAWLTVKWAAVWLLIQVVSSYSFSPSLPAAQYYGQIAEQRGVRAMFHGQVESASIGTIPIINGALAGSHSIRELLSSGAPMVGVVRVTVPTPNFASIIRIADDKQRGIASISEEADRLVFSIRTGASTLRLREPAFGMPGVFFGGRSTADSAAETLVMSARFDDGTVRLTAQNRSLHHELNFAPRAAQAWTVLLPFHGHLESGGAEPVATFLWASVLLIPLGYWAATLTRQQGRWAVFSLFAVLAGVVAIGLMLVPAVFALRGAALLDWIATLCGLALGATLTLRFGANRTS